MRLAQWQDDFAGALAGGDHPLARQPGFAVYRNTVWRGWIDALIGNFPAVARLTGEAWIAGAARAYAAVQPPRTPILADYGDTFPAFLRDFPPAAALPFLHGAALLDRAWSRAHLAADDGVASLDDLAALTPESMATRGARLHASHSLYLFPATLPDLWLASRDDLDGGVLALEDRGQGVLIVRPADTVAVMLLTPAAHRFAARLDAGGSLLAAAVASAGDDPAFDPGQTLHALVAMGALAAFTDLSSGDLP